MTQKNASFTIEIAYAYALSMTECYVDKKLC